MYKLLIASNNQNKVNEIKQILKGLDIRIVSLKDENIDIDPEENGVTFAENAIIKAKALFEFTGLPVLADDSGLIVDLLGSKPGVYSKRYAGPNATDDDNNKKVVNEIKNKKEMQSKAKFVCSIAFIDEKGQEKLFEGECRGIFITTPKGSNGFGYDPYFYIEEYDRTMAQLGSKDKNKISHRGIATKKFAEYIKRNSLMTVSFIILTALALSLDAFAVSVSCGITNSAKKLTDKIKLALFFGVFQGGMPLISYYLTNLVLPGSSRYAGYISAIIMFAIGTHMIIEFRKKEEECGFGKLTLKRILLLSVATSIDAFAAGLTFALMEGNIFIAISGIAGITFILSLAGVFFGCKIGGKFKKSAELIGAIMLILIGIKFLLDAIL